MPAPVLAIDFGTSNSAAAMLEAGRPRRLRIEQGQDTLPTAVFFPDDGSEMCIGTAAARALVSGEDGRYMRALKSILGTSLFHEKRLIGGKRRTLADIVTAFLATVRTRAETQTGLRFDHALSGRPVQFHSTDASRNARAETDLHDCYTAAGFSTVRFMFEPEAAAWASGGLTHAGQPGLIVDIGGGTSDFSVFETVDGTVRILASHGIRLGGTDFDRAVSMRHVMAHLGHGGQLRRAFGDGLLPVPNSLYADLATWAKIPFLYSPDTLRTIADLRKFAVDPVPMARLHAVITHRLGHELAFAAEAGKIAANSGTRAMIDMGYIESGLGAPITPASLNAALVDFHDSLRAALYATLIKANTPPAQIGSVILVGGSSLMTLVAETAQAVCPSARTHRADAFTAVVDGLALATADA